MLRADAVMDAAQPCFEIGEHEMDDGQKGFCDLHVAPLRDGGVAKAAFAQLRVTAPVVGDNGRAWRHGAFDEDAQRLGASVRHHRKPDAPGVPPGLPFVEAAGMLALTDFDGTCHDDHIVDAASFAARATAHVGFIGFDGIEGIATNPILVRTHHADTQFVKNLEGSLVARQAKLPLELNSRYTWCLAGDQVCRPEPDRKRRMREFHNGASGKTRVAATLPATEYTGASGYTIRFAGCAATRTDKPVAPSGAFKISHARRLIRKQALEFRKRAWKRQVVSLKYVDNHGCNTLKQMLNILHLVGVCDNPISTV